MSESVSDGKYERERKGNVSLVLSTCNILSKNLKK